MKKTLKYSIICLTFIFASCEQLNYENANNSKPEFLSKDSIAIPRNSTVQRGEGRVRLESTLLDTIFKVSWDKFAGICIRLNKDNKREIDFFLVVRNGESSIQNPNFDVFKIHDPDGRHLRREAERPNGIADDFEFIDSATTEDPNESFSFAYFTPLEAYPVIIRENFEVYGTYIDFGKAPSAILNNGYFSFRIEGRGRIRREIFTSFGITSKDTMLKNITLPYFQAGFPCPPRWPPDMLPNDKKFIDNLTEKLKQI